MGDLLVAHRAAGILRLYSCRTLHAEEIVATRHERGDDFSVAAYHTILLLDRVRHVVVLNVIVIGRVGGDVRRRTGTYDTVNCSRSHAMIITHTTRCCGRAIDDNGGARVTDNRVCC